MALMIFEELGIEDFDEKNLKTCCPFHTEDHPSFIWNKKALSFHCFGACGRNYDILDVYMYKGLTYIEAVQRLFSKAGIAYPFGEHKVRTNRPYRYPKEVVCSSKERVYQYLEKRKISKQTVDYLDIREDEDGNIVFNYYDTNDVLAMVKYRPSHKISPGENKNWCQKNADTCPLLYNMNRINLGQPLLITSGELDCAAAIESGWINAVSIPFGDGNTHWFEYNFDWLEQFNEIIVCPDNDESGYKYVKNIVPRLGSWRCKVVSIPDNCKDLNEVLYRYGKDKVLEVITHAKDTPVSSVNDLSDIEDIDLDKIDGVHTGMSEIDKTLMKLFYGTLTIVSGVPGSGKTSFLYQLVCQALDQGVSSWLFSRELPEWMSRNWFNYIMAGRRHLTEFESSSGNKYYKVTPEAKREIGDHYRGQWFVYRDDHSNKLDDLLTSMTDVVRKYGVKLLILDNLMTIDIDANEHNELQKQTEAINKLIQFSMRFDVAVILVAHPRKLQAGAEVGIYDISGTSNIINLAHRTIGLKRVTPTEKMGVPKQTGKGWLTPPIKHDVLVTIIKDRILGKANTTIGLYYDIPSRRFFSNPDEFEHNYKWDKRIYTDHLEYPIVDEEEDVFGSITNDGEEQ